MSSILMMENDFMTSIRRRIELDIKQLRKASSLSTLKFIIVDSSISTPSWIHYWDKTFDLVRVLEHFGVYDIFKLFQSLCMPYR